MRDVQIRGATGIAATVLLGVGSLLAQGCAAVDPPPEDRFYRLAPEAEPPGAAEGPALPGVLAVERPRADALTGERALVWTRGGTSPRLERHRYHYWVEPPTDAVQQHLADFLRRAGVARAVVTPAARVQADYRLTGRLERFERVLGAQGPAVHVALRLSLQDAGDAAILWREVYGVRRAAADRSVEEAVRAFEEALEEILPRVAEDLRRAGSRLEAKRAGAMLPPRP